MRCQIPLVLSHLTWTHTDLPPAMFSYPWHLYTSETMHHNPDWRKLLSLAVTFPPGVVQMKIGFCYESWLLSSFLHHNISRRFSVYSLGDWSSGEAGKLIIYKWLFTEIEAFPARIHAYDHRQTTLRLNSANNKYDNASRWYFSLP